MIIKILVCGTRKKGYNRKVVDELDRILQYYKNIRHEIEIIEGCCPDSADAYAEKWCERNGVVINHFPSTKGNYLKRNIEMVEFCDRIIAFWDGYSYGTAHAVANGVMINKKVRIIPI